MIKSHTTRIMTGTGSDEYGTPPYIYAWLNELFYFDVDGAASDTNHLCERYFTRDNSALDRDWVHADGSPMTVFINPPYGRGKQEPFFRKAAEQAHAHDVVSALLVPVRTETPRWRHYVPQASDVLLIGHRLKFIDPETGEPVPTGHPYPSAVVIFAGRGRGQHDPRWTFCTTPRA